MLKKYLILIIFIFASFLIAPKTEANICKFWSGHQVCVVRIKRSAKYYWEYRTTLSVDGKKQPEIVYDCRYFSYLQPDNTKGYFDERPHGVSQPLGSDATLSRDPAALKDTPSDKVSSARERSARGNLTQETRECEDNDADLGNFVCSLFNK